LIYNLFCKIIFNFALDRARFRETLQHSFFDSLGSRPLHHFPL
jgi:hypothetical protein